MNKKTKKTIALALALVLGLGGVYYGLPKFKGKSKPVKVYEAYSPDSEFLEDGSGSSYGQVTADDVQTVKKSATMKVTKILVKKGDTVQVGDPLLTYDTTLTEIKLEKEKNSLDAKELSVKHLEQYYNKLLAASPGDPVIDPGRAEGGLPGSSEKGSDSSDGEVSDDSSEDGEDLEEASAGEGDLGGASASTGLSAVMSSLTSSLGGQKVLAGKEEGPVRLKGKGSKKNPFVYYWKDSFELNQKSLEEMIKKPGDISGDASGNANSETWVILEFKKSKKGDTLYRIGLRLYKSDDGSIAMKLFDPDYIESQEDPEDPGDDGFDEGEDGDGGDTYTEKSLADLRAKTGVKLKKAKIAFQIQKINYNRKVKEAKDGVIRSKIAGRVQTAVETKDVENTDGNLLVISGSKGGFFVKVPVSEFDVTSIEKDRKVKVTTMDAMEEFEGQVVAVSEYPVEENSMGGGGGNPNASYYGCTVRIGVASGIREDDYVNVDMTKKDGRKKFYTSSIFVKYDGGGAYVMQRNKKGLLEKTYVVTGKTLYDSFIEILDGLDEKAYVANPNDSKAVEGARTVKGSLDELLGFG